MTTTRVTHWDPETYARFRGLRLRPALDLLVQVPDVPAGDIVDLGCGNGSVGLALRQRFPDRVLVGVDRAPEMLEKARDEAHYDTLITAEISTWNPAAPVALIFSNAALHWLPDHDHLMPSLCRFLVKGGVLAVQMPRQYDAPSHRLLRAIAADMFPDRFDFAETAAPVWPASRYIEALSALGQVDAWETEYVHQLEASDVHPVRRFTEGAAMLPFLQAMTLPEQTEFVRRYDAALGAVYHRSKDGSVLFPFRRCFFILRV